MSPNDHDFDWVQAQLGCSPLCEYRRIVKSVKDAVKVRQDALMKLDPDSRDRIECAEFDAALNVYRIPKPGKTNGIVFELDGDKDLIAITDYATRTTLVVTLTLNDEGECRYKIDGEGEYLRWQVARKVLEPMFF